MAHWIEDERARGRFWANAKDALGLTEDDVHAALGVASVKDFEKGEADAYMYLEGYRNAMRGTLELSPMPEAPLVAWTKIVTRSGYEWSITWREMGQPEGERKQLLTNMRETIELLERGAAKYGWRPAGGIPPYEEPEEEGPVYVDIEEEDGTVERIDYLKVTAPEGKPIIELWRGNRKYAELKWYLGGDAFLKMCPALQRQFTPEILDTPSAQQHRVQLEAIWKPSPKNPKWRDIVAVRVRDA